MAREKPGPIKIYSAILNDIIVLFTDYTEEEIRWLLKATLGMTQEEKADYLIKVHQAKKVFPDTRVMDVRKSQEPQLEPEPKIEPPKEEVPPEPEAVQKSLWEF